MSVIYSSKTTNKKSPKKIIKTPESQRIILDIKKSLGWDKTQNMGAFKAFPQKVSFETQESQEAIVLLLRKHIITNLTWILTALLLVLAPLLLSYIPFLEFLPFRFKLMTIIAWYLFILAFLVEKFLSWYFNVYIITDERVIDVDFYSLVYKRISETKIENIEDVSYSQGGFIQSIFNFGLVNIQTAGEVPEFEFEAVPQPALVAKVLNQLKIQEEQEKIEGRVR